METLCAYETLIELISSQLKDFHCCDYEDCFVQSCTLHNLNSYEKEALHEMFIDYMKGE